MMTTISSYVRQGRHLLRRWALDPKLHTYAKAALHGLTGFAFSAASLAHSPLPLVMGLVCAGSAWSAVLIATGGALGYLLFWGTAGLQPIVWTAAGLMTALTLGERPIIKRTPMLIPSIAMLIVSAGGVVFQFWLGDNTSVPVYLLRVAAGAGSAWIFCAAKERRHPVAEWLATALGVLALAQIRPIPYLGLGYIAAGFLCATGTFPAAALAGLALDLARITPTPMTAVLCLAYLVRLLPRGSKWLTATAPGVAFPVVMALCGAFDLQPLPGLLIGGITGVLLPGSPQPVRRRGETGIAQVRLEMAAASLLQAQQLLLEAQEAPIDQLSLVRRAADRACGSCANRKTCREKGIMEQLSPQILSQSLLEGRDLPAICKKSGRILAELHRAQEQLRTLKASHRRQEEYRTAVVQQYRFLAEYLQELSDGLARRMDVQMPRFQTQVQVYSNRPQDDNGDRCIWFSGTENRYYILLCDGMGTGLGAMDEGRNAAACLRRLLSAGYPAEHALRSLNSLCALRGRAGAVTVDLAELWLDTGKAAIYKWGAAPSYLLTAAGAEKIGTAGPPPGLSVTEGRETVERLSLRRGETLVLCSDGVGGEDALRALGASPGAAPGELAQTLLEHRGSDCSDDATIAFIRLESLSTATS